MKIHWRKDIVGSAGSIRKGKKVKKGKKPTKAKQAHSYFNFSKRFKKMNPKPKRYKRHTIKLWAFED